MSEILRKVEQGQVIYLTEKSIKSIVCGITETACINRVYDRLIEKYEIDLSRHNTMNCRILDDYQTWKLSILR